MRSDFAYQSLALRPRDRRITLIQPFYIPFFSDRVYAFTSASIFSLVYFLVYLLKNENNEKKTAVYRAFAWFTILFTGYPSPLPSLSDSFPPPGYFFRRTIEIEAGCWRYTLKLSATVFTVKTRELESEGNHFRRTVCLEVTR